MHPEMDCRSVTDSHGMRQPIRKRAARSANGLAERSAQKIVARFRLDGNKLVHVFGFQYLPQARFVDFLCPSHEFVTLWPGHCFVSLDQAFSAFYCLPAHEG